MDVLREELSALLGEKERADTEMAKLRVDLDSVE
jgi:hypothetical protein